jgi:hypothetical protein
MYAIKLDAPFAAHRVYLLALYQSTERGKTKRCPEADQRRHLLGFHGLSGGDAFDSGA